MAVFLKDSHAAASSFHDGAIKVTRQHQSPREPTASNHKFPQQLFLKTADTDTGIIVSNKQDNSDPASASSPILVQEQPLQEDCELIGEDFLCDVNFVLNRTSPPEGTVSAEPIVSVVVEAAVDCSVAVDTAFNSLSQVPSATCQCTAVLTPTAGALPQECPCQVCPGPQNSHLPLSIDCTANAVPVISGCIQVACDGTCLDPVAVAETMAPSENTTLNRENSNATVATAATVSEEGEDPTTNNPNATTPPPTTAAPSLMPETSNQTTTQEEMTEEPTAIVATSANNETAPQQSDTEPPATAVNATNGDEEEVAPEAEEAEAETTAPEQPNATSNNNESDIQEEEKEEAATTAPEQPPDGEAGIEGEEETATTAPEQPNDDESSSNNNSTTTTSECFFCPDGAAPESPSNMIALSSIERDNSNVVSCIDYAQTFDEASVDKCPTTTAMVGDGALPIAIADGGDASNAIFLIDLRAYCQCEAVPSEPETCGPLCPNGQAVLLDQSEVLVEGSDQLTCGMLQEFVAYINNNDPDQCDAMAAYASQCCAPVPPPENRIPWWIPSAWIMYNTENVKANDLSDADRDGILQAYQAMVLDVVNDIVPQPVSASSTTASASLDPPQPPPNRPKPQNQPNQNQNANQTQNQNESQQQQQQQQQNGRYLRQSSSAYRRSSSHPRRQLNKNNLLLNQEATEVYLIEDRECPTPNAARTCVTVYGRYQLLLQEDDVADTTAISNEYITATQNAIDNDQLQQELDAVDSDNILTVLQSDFRLTPAIASESCSFCETGEDPKAMNKGFVAGQNSTGQIGDFTCSSLVDLYAAQSADVCLNYSPSGGNGLPPPLATFLTTLPIHYQTYCECPPEATASVYVPPQTCDAFCPDNKRVPEVNLDVVIDPLLQWTCGNLEHYADSVIDGRLCPLLERHGAICCTERIKESIDGNSTAPEPTPPPTANGTEYVEISSYILTYNMEMLTADSLMLGPEMEVMTRSYSLFVNKVMGEVASGNVNGSISTSDQAAADTGNATTPLNSASLTNETNPSNASRYLRSPKHLEWQLQNQQSHRRRLRIVLDESSPAIHDFVDTPCPSTVMQGATCTIAHGSYLLLLTEGEDPDITASFFTNYTNDAIDRGLLGETMEEVDSLTELVVVSSVDEEEYETYVQQNATVSPRAAEEGGYDEYFMVSLGVSIAIIVMTLVFIICASDYSGYQDDDSVDPWDRELARSASQRSMASIRSKGSVRSRGSVHSKESAPQRRRSRSGDPIPTESRPTEKQEYDMYRAQIETLIDQKMPEERDNIDDLMDQFYQREPLLIATLRHMPDCSEHAPQEDGNASRAGSRFEDSQGWMSFADDSFAVDSEDGDDADEAQEVMEETMQEPEEKRTNVRTYHAISMSNRTIPEGSEDADEASKKLDNSKDDNLPAVNEEADESSDKDTDDKSENDESGKAEEGEAWDDEDEESDDKSNVPEEESIHPEEWADES